MAAKDFTLEPLTERVGKLMGMSVDEVTDSGKDSRSVKARSMLYYWATNQLRISPTQLAQVLNLTQLAFSQAVKRGKQLAKMKGYSLIDGKTLLFYTRVCICSFHFSESLWRFFTQVRPRLCASLATERRRRWTMFASHEKSVWFYL